MKICALIAAAGKGTRLGMNSPKILLSIQENRTIWHILRDILMPHVDHIHVVLSSAVEPIFLQEIADDSEQARISTSIQAVPIGMGDAIFGAQEFWSSFDILLVVWGDQVNLSAKTIESVTTSCGNQRTIILPLATMVKPYVQYDFEGNDLIRVRQAREGDAMDLEGASDVGLFALAVPELVSHWNRYLQQSLAGIHTGEINFLPFLPFLSRECGWVVHPIFVPDQAEARGVNTPEDLQFAIAHLAWRDLHRPKKS